MELHTSEVSVSRQGRTSPTLRALCGHSLGSRIPTFAMAATAALDGEFRAESHYEGSTLKSRPEGLLSRAS